MPHEPEHVAPASQAKLQLSPAQSNPQLPFALHVQLASPAHVQSGPPGHALVPLPHPNGRNAIIPKAKIAPVT